MTEAQRATVDYLGRFGMVARGVIFGMVGIFILEAGLHRDAHDAHSFGPAFEAVAREPLGHVLLAIVALGFAPRVAALVGCRVWLGCGMRRRVTVARGAAPGATAAGHD